MRSSRDFASMSDPGNNPQFGRRWVDDPLSLPDFQHLAREATPKGAFNLKRQRQIEHVHRLGVRAVGELLHQVAKGEDLDSALGAYQCLTPNLLKAVGGDRFPPLPIHEVQQP